MPESFIGAVGVEALGDGVGDDGLALFLEQVDQLFLLGHQRVDLGGFVVEESGDGSLLLNGGWKADMPSVPVRLGTG